MFFKTKALISQIRWWHFWSAKKIQFLHIKGQEEAQMSRLQAVTISIGKVPFLCKGTEHLPIGTRKGRGRNSLRSTCWFILFLLCIWAVPKWKRRRKRKCLAWWFWAIFNGQNLQSYFSHLHMLDKGREGESHVYKEKPPCYVFQCIQLLSLPQNGNFLFPEKMQP